MIEYKVKEVFLSFEKDKEKAKEFLQTQNLELAEDLEKYFGVFADEKIVAGGGFAGQTIKSVAVSCRCQGGNVIELIMSRIIEEMNSRGITDIYIFTKPESAQSFSYLGFTELARSSEAVLLENSSLNIRKYLANLKQLSIAGNNGAVVVNCNPFTLGHQYLLETAAKQVDHLYVFVVSEDKSSFPSAIRFKLVKEGLAHLKNVTVIMGGNYIISSATFPTYFLKQKSAATRIQAELDATIFSKYIAKNLNITKRFVGEEPYCEVTNSYNEALKKILKQSEIELKIIPRKEFAGQAISASRVRKVIKEENLESLQDLVPKVTFDFLTSESTEAIKIIEKIRSENTRH